VDLFSFIFGYTNYIAVVVLMMIGLYVIFSSGNLVKRLVGLGVFQTSVFLLYISVSKVAGATPPILPAKKKAKDGYGDAVTAPVDGAGELTDSLLQAPPAEALYSNPLPHVLILTAIVVGVATLAVGLALVVRIREAYGTIEDDDINAAEYSVEIAGGDA
jgi:multicomponent Na+:H+ antiporter subunit C